jgi:DNA-binding beta-propeller fold protein YncE
MKKNNKKIVCVSCFILLFASLACADAVFVNLNSSPWNRVAAFRVNADGSLTSVPGSPFFTWGAAGYNGNTGGMALAGLNLYVVNSATNSVSGFAVDPLTYVLTPIPGSPWPTRDAPIGVAVTPSGDRLYVANGANHLISVYAIQANGSLIEIVGSPFSVQDDPFFLLFSSDGRFLYVSLPGSNTIGAYAVAADGSLSALPGSPFYSPGYLTFALAATPDRSRIYACNYSSHNVSGFSVSSNGTLAALPASPYGGVYTPVGIVCHPNGEHLFVANVFANCISTMAIAANGSLSPTASSPFASSGSGPVGMAINPQGTFLFVTNGYATGTSTNDVGVYAIGTGGSLTPIPGSPFPNNNPSSLANASGICYLADPCTVTFSAGAGGWISGGSSQTVAYGGNATPVTAVPNEGYHFTGWSGTGGFSSTANPLTLTHVIQSMQISGGFDNAPPTVEITSPTDGSVVRGTIAITAQATDDLAVERVEFYIDGILQAGGGRTAAMRAEANSQAAYSCSWDTSRAANGVHRIRAVAYDNADASAPDEIAVTVANIRIGLTATRASEKAWVVQRDYGKIAFSVDNPSLAPDATYFILRRQSGTTYQTVKQVSSSELQSGAYAYPDKWLEKGQSYIYRIEARAADGTVIAASPDVTI